VARVHEKIANQRKDAIHKATTEAVRESQAIAVEDLNVAGMEKSRHLAKAVSDASMSEMARQLEYKCAWYGRAFVKVGRFYPSSKTCSCCGYVNKNVVLGRRGVDLPRLRGPPRPRPQRGEEHRRRGREAAGGRKRYRRACGNRGRASAPNARGAGVRPIPAKAGKGYLL
jgi:IS605 OrfB family transposase